ncbi:MAG: hypothetical protein ACI9MR_000690 [Myxococcota bacterium]|jgi:hypothetical protein
MDDTIQTSAYEDPREAPRKRPLWRNILRWFGIVTGSLLGLVCLILAFIHTPWGQDFLRGQIEAGLQKNWDGKVTLGGLEFGLFDHVALSDLTIAQPDGKKVVQVKRVDVDLDWSSLLSKPLTVEKLALDGLTIDLVQFDDGTSNIKRMQLKQAKLPNAIRVNDLAVTNVNVAIIQPNGGTLNIKDLTVLGALGMDKDAGTTQANIKTFAAHITAVRPDGVTIAIPLSTGLSLAQTPTSINAKVNPLDTVATVTRAGQAPLEVPVKFQGMDVTQDDSGIRLSVKTFDGGPLHMDGLDALVKLGTDGLPTGPQSLALKGVVVDGEQVNTLLGRQALKSDIKADFSIIGPMSALVIDGDVVTDGGTFKLDGTADAADFKKPAYDIVLLGENIDTTKLLAGPKAPNLQTGFRITVKGTGAKPGATDATLTAKLEPTTANGRKLDDLDLVATVKGPVLKLSKLDVTAYGETLSLDGEFNQETRLFNGHLKTDTTLADAIAKVREAGILNRPLPNIVGALDIDMTIAGKLTPEGETRTMMKFGQMKQAEVPVEWASLKGYARANGLAAMGSSVEKLDLTADMRVEPPRPSGSLSLLVRDLNLAQKGGKPPVKIESIDGKLGFDGLDQTLALVVRDAPTDLALDLNARSHLDLDGRRAQATIEKFEVKRGHIETKLLDPLSLDLAFPDPNGGTQVITIPPVRLALAGGELVLAGSARLESDPNNPGKLKLGSATADIDMKRLNLRKLAALARRRIPVAGVLSGTMSFEGTPDDPDLAFQTKLTARARGGKPATVTTRGSVRDKRLTLDGRVTDRSGRLLAKLAASAPLALGGGRKPGLAPGGRLKVDLEIPERKLSAFGSLLPKGLPPAADPNGTVMAELHLKGSPARPTGTWSLDLEGGFLRRRPNMDHMPATQRIKVGGGLRQNAGKTELRNATELWLDGAKGPLTELTVDGTFDRSPLLKTGLRRPFEIAMAMSPVALADVPMQPGKPALAGTIAGGAKLNSAGNDLTGKMTFTGSQVAAGDKIAPADITSVLTLSDENLTVDMDVLSCGLSLVTVDGTVGVGGKGIKTLLKPRNRAKLMRAPLDLTIAMPPHRFSELAPILPQRKLSPTVLHAPGTVGGSMKITGTAGVPLADGFMGWQDFTTLTGAPGRIGFGVNADESQVVAGLYMGGADALSTAPVKMEVSLDRDQLPPKDAMAITLRGQADNVDMLSLVPDFRGTGETGGITGRLDMDMSGRFAGVRDTESMKWALDAAKSALDGHMTIRDGRMPIPESRRVVDQIVFKLTTAMDAIGLEISAHEADWQRDDRTLVINGTVALADFMPQTASMDIKTERWLALGQGQPSPQGDVTIDMHVDAAKLLEPVKDIEVTIKSMHLHAPNNFPRAHYQQFLSYGDIFFLDEHSTPSGFIPGGPKPPSDAPIDAAAVADAAKKGFDVRLRMPNPIRVQFWPADLNLQGAMDVTMRGKDVELQGKIDVVGGSLGAMGRTWVLNNGAVTANGGLETVKAEIHLDHAIADVPLRDVSLAGDHKGNANITVLFTVAKGLQTPFGGAAGYYLLDVATVLNTGRAPIWGRPDTPASQTAQFGTQLQGLINSFVQTNLRNLVFMDRANGWSLPMDYPSEYGWISNFEMERYIADNGQRLRFIAQRPSNIGQNRMELQYDFLFDYADRNVVGMGARLGSDARLGLGLFWEFESEE